MTFVCKYGDLEPREIVKKHAMKRGGERANAWMSPDDYERFVAFLRALPPDMINSTGQRGYRIVFNGVPLIAAWSDEHDCIVTFLPEPHRNWRAFPEVTSLGEVLAAALAKGRPS